MVDESAAVVGQVVADNVDMTVVVIGYRDGSTIASAVNSILLQETGCTFEVVVVVSGPDDGLDELQRSSPEVFVHAHPQRLMPGAARNVGVGQATGRIVAFLAADCVAAPGWIQARLDAHGRGYDVVGCAVGFAGRPWPWVVASHVLQYRTRRPDLPREVVRGGEPRAHGLSITRTVLAEVGPYDPDVRVGEDTEMARRLDAAGHAILFEPRAVLFHTEPGTPAAMLRDQYRRGSLRPDAAGVRTGSVEAGFVAAVVRPAWTRARRSGAAAIRSHHVPTWSAILSLPWIVLGALAAEFGARSERR